MRAGQIIYNAIKYNWDKSGSPATKEEVADAIFYSENKDLQKIIDNYLKITGEVNKENK